MDSKAIYVTSIALLWAAGCSETSDPRLCDNGVRCAIGEVCAARTNMCIRPGCGDGDLEAGELCDDGNLVGGDGCSADCRSDETCGNGITDSVVGEVCDGDGCRDDCLILGTCGDGEIDPGEDCDPGLETPRCNWNCTTARCGDGQVNEAAGEECDTVGDTAECDRDCTLPACGDYYHNPYNEEACDQGPAGGRECTSRCTISYCGDGLFNEAAGEECDDGGPSARCFEDCSLSTCGDGAVNPLAGEQCDPGFLPSAACDVDCTWSECGDQVINAPAGEQCDDGGQSATCLDTCRMSFCGDGVVNTSAGEDCDTSGQSASCDSDCTEAVCGDGRVNAAAGEQCDDGGESAGCLTTCEISVCGDGVINPSAGEDCDAIVETAECNIDCTDAVCGDGYINATAGEVCDDAGATAYCTGACRIGPWCGQECVGDDDCDSGRCIDGRCQAARLSAGGSHTCALIGGTAVRCWGNNAAGQLGLGHIGDIGDDEDPADAGDIDLFGAGAATSIVQIAAGNQHTCALLATGAVRCWGEGFYGQLGYGDMASGTDNVGDDERPGDMPEVNIVGATGARVVQLDAGYAHTCALLDTGAVRCWGDDSDGQLGYAGTGRIGDDEAPAAAGDVGGFGAGGARVVQIATGGWHTCALLDTDPDMDTDRYVVRCWGYGSVGQLGYGDTDDIDSATAAGDVDVVGLLDASVVQLTAGDLHTCALLDTGAVRCWGYGGDGQLGYGNTDAIGDDEDPATAGDVPAFWFGQVIQITAGARHTCAIHDSGAVNCWGRGDFGRLGLGGQSDIGDNEPPWWAGALDLVGGSGPGAATRAIEVHAGDEHTCAILDNCAIRCWGYGEYGRLGYGDIRWIGDDESPASAGDVSYR